MFSEAGGNIRDTDAAVATAVVAGVVAAAGVDDGAEGSVGVPSTVIEATVAAVVAVATLSPSVGVVVVSLDLSFASASTSLWCLSNISSSFSLAIFLKVDTKDFFSFLPLIFLSAVFLSFSVSAFNFLSSCLCVCSNLCDIGNGVGDGGG